MVDLGPRYPGSSAHATLVDHMQEVFERHAVTVNRDRYFFDKWTPRHTSLTITSGADSGALAVAAPYPNSGATAAGGVTAPLTYLAPLVVPAVDEISHNATLESIQAHVDTAVARLLAAVPGGVTNRIVVVENPVPPLTVGMFNSLMSYRHDPGHTVSDSDSYSRVWMTLLTATSLTAFRQAGAVASILILDAHPANALGQVAPFTRLYQDLPALIVDREQGARLRRAARDGAQATLELQATVERRSSDSLIGVLRGSGRGGEALIVHTHSDGMNAFEENGVLAQLRLAEYLDALGPDRRNRDIIFSAVTGHFGPGLPETKGFLEAHPDLVARSVASLTIEHFGATEWVDDAGGYRSTGQVEPAVAFHSPTRIVEPAIEATRHVDLRRLGLLRPIGTTFFGVGRDLHAAGIPSIAYIGGPTYLCAEAPNGHLDKLDPARMAAELAWTADLLGRLDTVPAEQLRS
ncbi:hypothetical protein [Nocardia sp. NPDC050435]|uniref:hypothetical protein n=1 Tax=Nocardia sp. NPDC050435 TaxID=3155040 RepID=UPI0033C1E125